jgi:ABC-type antimicrobial peptide transport system permease subunit
MTRTALIAFGAGAVLATTYALLTLLLLRGMSVAPRRRALGTLRVLGMEERGRRRLLTIELAPMALTGVAVGVACGLLIPVLIRPGLDLGRFAGGRPDPELVVDVTTLATLTVGIVLAAAVTVALAVLSAKGDARR